MDERLFARPFLWGVKLEKNLHDFGESLKLVIILRNTKARPAAEVDEFNFKLSFDSPVLWVLLYHVQPVDSQRLADLLRF